MAVCRARSSFTRMGCMINQAVNFHLTDSSCWCAHFNSRIHMRWLYPWHAGGIFFVHETPFTLEYPKKTSWTHVRVDSCPMSSRSVVRCRRERKNHPRVMLSCFCMDVCPAEWNVQVVFAYSESTTMFVMSYLWPISWCGSHSGGHSCLT